MATISKTAPAVFITVPKYVAITPSITGSQILPKIRPAPSTAQAEISSTTSGYDSSVSDEGPAPKGRKRRLDHLSWEEKVQRKKLKNRVAAQTSRDRKKARMEDMEHEINELTERTELLQNKCDSMQAMNEALMEKNQKLDKEVELLRQQLTELQQQQQSSQHRTLTATCAGCESILNGSAVSIYTDDPLQQGSTNKMDSQSTEVAVAANQLGKSSTLAALWRIVALCLLYKTCSSSTSSTTTMKNNSMPASWKNLPKVYSQISQQTWKQAIERAMKLLPKLQAEQSACLDQWWGPKQSAWNPAKITKTTAVSA